VTLPDLHLSEDALAAYADGILSPREGRQRP